MRKLPPAVQGLLIANVAMFLISLLASHSQAKADSMVQWFGLWFPRNPNFGIWQLFTSMFMHGGFMHIFFNMFALVSFGMLLERLWGTRRFLEFYFICGLGAALIYTGVNMIQFHSLHEQLVATGVPAPAIAEMLRSGQYPTGLPAESVHLLVKLYTVYGLPMIGASGAIYGVLVAFSFLFPNARLFLMFVPVAIPAKYFIPILVALDLLGGLTHFSLFGGNIAHFAHLGGALIGFLLMWYWRRQTPVVRYEPGF